jgi:molybdopterin converting factor small subunit
MKVIVEVKFFADLIDEIGIRSIVVETENTISDVIKSIENVTGFPLSQRLDEGYSLLINGRSFKVKQNRKYVLRSGDKLAVMPRLGGG